MNAKNPSTGIVNLKEARTNFSRLLKRVERGEHVIIARAGTPIAKIVPLDFPKTLRIPGQDEGQVMISPDFDDELPEEELILFES